MINCLNMVNTRCSKKTLLKEMCDFLTLKMLPLASVDQNKKSLSFLPTGQKMLILRENLEFLMATK